MIVRMPAPVLSLKSNPIKKSLYKLMVFLSARKLATPLALDIRNKKVFCHFIRKHDCLQISCCI